MERSEVAWHLRSRGPSVRPGEMDVAVADTTGELRDLTQLADIVFVGKSLPPHTEGQTPIEAAALHKPVLFGPGMGNFRQIASELVESGAARVVPAAAELPGIVTTLLGSESDRATLAARAAAWHKANLGATDRTLAVIRELLGSAESRL